MAAAAASWPGSPPIEHAGKKFRRSAVRGHDVVEILPPPLRNQDMPTSPANVVLDYLRRLTRTAEADPSSDQELLARFVGQRDEESFAALLRRHGPMVWRLCQR